MKIDLTQAPTILIPGGALGTIRPGDVLYPHIAVGCSGCPPLPATSAQVLREAKQHAQPMEGKNSKVLAIGLHT